LAGLGVAALSFGILLSNSTIFASQGTAAPEPVRRVNADDLKWVDEPNGLGFKTAIVEGDPAKPGLYIIRVKFPPWVMSMPHFHFEPDKTIALKPGSFMKHPSGAHHFDGSKGEEVILQWLGGQLCPPVFQFLSK
jgi:hypothetical protein